jgi:MscS family membrane protein
MIFMDKPFQVGDFVEIGGQFGSVVEVGFRSTRIMTKDSSVLSIPNGQVANMNLRNLGVRRFRLFETEIGLTYDTPAYLIEQFIEGIRKIMRLHPLVMPEEQYVYFSKMADSSLNVFVRVNIDTQVWAEELDVKQELYLDIIRMAYEMGIRFAFPSRTLYIEDFPEKKSLVPDYSEAKIDIEQKRDRYLAALQEKYEQRPAKDDP